MASNRNALVELQRALPRADSAAAYGVTALVIVVASVVKFPLDGWAGEPLPPFITFYPVVVLASLVGGPRIGLLAAIATLLLAWYLWIPNPFSFEISGRRTPLMLVLYGVSVSLLAWVVGLARLTLDQVAASEAERATSARESVHRIKNLVAVVQAMTSKISREVSTTAEFRDLLTKRLEALGAAQNVLIRQDWSDVQLQEVVASSLAPFLPNPGLHLTPGPPVVVPARHVSGLCLALYELSTNAMKYGALANGEGPVTLGWRCENDMCILEWREARRSRTDIEMSGFGSLLIKSALSQDHRTAVDYEFTPTEVIATFRWPTQS